MKTLIGIVIILMCCSNYQGQANLDGKTFYWVDSNNDFFMSPKKSILEFKNDSIIIIDFPFDPAGTLIYNLGTYKINQNTSTIECLLHKCIVFSMNIGQVISYTNGCNSNLIMSISKEGNLIRKHRKDRMKMITKGEWTRLLGKVNMKYKTIDKNNPPISYDWTHMFDKYEHKEKLKECD